MFSQLSAVSGTETVKGNQIVHLFRFVGKFRCNFGHFSVQLSQTVHPSFYKCLHFNRSTPRRQEQVVFKDHVNQTMHSEYFVSFFFGNKLLKQIWANFLLLRQQINQTKDLGCFYISFFGQHINAKQFDCIQIRHNSFLQPSSLEYNKPENQDEDGP